MASLHSESLKTDMLCWEMVDTSGLVSLKIFHDLLWTIQTYTSNIKTSRNLCLNRLHRGSYKFPYLRDENPVGS